MARVKIKMALVIQERRGLDSRSTKAKIIKRPKRISTKILKAKPLPVIKGKYIAPGTIKAIKGTRNKPKVMT